MKNFDSKLYFITDSTNLEEEQFLNIVEEALLGGVTLLQLREKEKTTREYIDIAKKVHNIARKYNVPLIIDDRVDVALAVQAEGVHLGESDMEVFEARRILGDGKIIGATAKSVERALYAYKSGADYLGVGAIYPTTTKVKTVITKISTLSDICRAVPIAVNAIGGLKGDNISVLKGTGIRGICVVSAIMHAPSPREEARKLLKLL